LNLDKAISFADKLQIICAAEEIIFRLRNQVHIARQLKHARRQMI
jgi:hypothetical protein